MISAVKEKVKQYDRAVVLVVTAISVIFSIYLGAQRSLNKIIETSEVIQNVRLINARQEILNKSFAEDVGELRESQKEMRNDIKTILAELRKKY